MDSPQEFLRQCFDIGVKAVQPSLVLPSYLPDLSNHKGRVIVIGAGKASAQMAKILEDHYQRDDIEGIVVTRYGYSAPTKYIKILEANHPVPDQAGLNATKEIKHLVSNLTEDDLVMCLISGGGSALLPEPVGDIPFEEKQNINKDLLLSGATIHEINCIRKHLSGVKGGQLAQTIFPAKIHAFMISDVPGDDLSVIASGPTVPDHTTQQLSLEVLEHHKIDISQTVYDHLTDPANETPKEGDPAFKNVTNTIIASGQTALQAVKAFIEDNYNIEAIILGDGIEGESRAVATHMVQDAIKRGETARKPFALLSGGETTVIVKGNGQGGSNHEFALAAAMAANGHPNLYGMACDTDGTDGNVESAGALFTPDTLKHGQGLNKNPKDYLENNDSHGFFKIIGDDHIIAPGPTGTNVNDLRILLFST